MEGIWKEKGNGKLSSKYIVWKKCPFSIKKKNLKANKRKKGDKIKCLRKIFKIFKKFNHQGVAN